MKNCLVSFEVQYIFRQELDKIQFGIKILMGHHYQRVSMRIFQNNKSGKMKFKLWLINTGWGATVRCAISLLRIFPLTVSISRINFVTSSVPLLNSGSTRDRAACPRFPRCPFCSKIANYVVSAVNLLVNDLIYNFSNC